MAVEVLFMNLNLCLIRLPILLSQSFSRSGSQAVTGNAYAMLSMIIAVFIMCMACQGEAYGFLRPVSFCFKVCHTCVLVCPVLAHNKLNAKIGKRVILLNEVCILSLDEYFVGELCPQMFL